MRSLLPRGLAPIVALVALTLLAPGRASAIRIAPRGTPPPNAIPTGPAPRRAVRSALRELAPDLADCAARYGLPGDGPRRRLHVRTWLYPNTGAYTLEIPELGTGAERRRFIRTERCIRAAVQTRLRPLMRRFEARTRLKIERSFVVRMPGPPPSPTQLRRLVTAERAALLRCVPGAGRRGERGAVVVRATLGRDGRLTLIGLGVPAAVDFTAAQACVATTLSEIRSDRVTSTATFETQLRIRFSDPTPPAD